LGKRGDVVFNGADDDGSGTVSVIEMAEAFAEAKKKEKSKKNNCFYDSEWRRKRIVGK
jgi:Zn-dependent M28 family amino/carboxypeptidase